MQLYSSTVVWSRCRTRFPFSIHGWPIWRAEIGSGVVQRLCPPPLPTVPTSQCVCVFLVSFSQVTQGGANLYASSRAAAPAFAGRVLSVPKELWRIVDWLFGGGRLDTPGLFATTGHPDEVPRMHALAQLF